MKKLKYIIEQSIDRGWDKTDNCSIWYVDESKDGRFYLCVDFTYSKPGHPGKRFGDIFDYPISDIFFNHDWAKCVAPNDPIGFMKSIVENINDEKRISYVYKYLKSSWWV